MDPAPMTPAENDLLEIDGLTIAFSTHDGVV
jgi:hypothetical protein